MNLKSNSFQFAQKFFWRFVLFFLVLYIVPYHMGFGFSDKFEEWEWWHKPIFWIGENILGWEFDYENPRLGWDSKFEVCRYIFISLFGSLLAIVWFWLDSFYFKKNYEEILIALTQTCLRYYIAITMLHYGLSKVFMHQFGTIDINALEGTIGDYSPMGLMWKYLSFSEEVQQFSGWVETIGAILLFFRRTTFFGAFLLIIALANVVLWDIGFSVSVTLYAIQLLLLTIVLMSNQFKSIYNLFSGKSAIANKYRALVTNPKYKRAALLIKIIAFIGLSYLYAKDKIEIKKDYFTNNYQWFTGLHTIDTFVVNGDTINENADSNKWKKVIFNDMIYFNDSFKIEFEDIEADEERFKYMIDSVAKTISYRDYQDEKASWNKMSYQQLDENSYLFKGVFKTDTISVNTTIKRFKDYNLIRKKGKWLIDLK